MYPGRGHADTAGTITAKKEKKKKPPKKPKQTKTEKNPKLNWWHLTLYHYVYISKSNQCLAQYMCNAI